ncbi:PH domain-containing protein [Bacillus subtilis subsp. subtilis]|nr:PH domain-containing protein [Bacillus subtilis subsp. subtilis]
MSAASGAAKDFAVAPAPVWRLLWLWVPMLACAGLIVTLTLQSAQRTPHELWLTLPFLALLTVVLSAAFFRRRIQVQGSTLEVVATFYRKRVPVDAMQLDRARVVDLAEYGNLAPVIKTNGYAMPGFKSGHYRLRDRSKAFCLITDASSVLYLPLRDGSALVISPEQPRALLAALQALAGPARAH